MPLIGHMAFHFIHSHRFLSVSLCLVYTKTERRTLFSCLITMHLHGSSRLDRRTKLMLYLYTSNTVEKKMTIPNLKIAPTNNSFWVVLCVSLCGCLYRRCCRRRLITKPMFDQIPKSEQCVRLIDKRCCICLRFISIVECITFHLILMFMKIPDTILWNSSFFLCGCSNANGKRRYYLLCSCKLCCGFRNFWKIFDDCIYTAR